MKKAIIYSYFFVILFGCIQEKGRSSSSNDKIIDSIGSNNPLYDVIDDSILIYQNISSIIPSIDSSICRLTKENTIRQLITNRDSFNKYKFLVDLFESTESILQLEIRTSPRRMPVKTNDTFIFTNSHTIYSLYFTTDEDAQTIFKRLSNDFLEGRLKGKIMFKAGGLILNENNVLILIPITSCASNSDLNTIMTLIQSFKYPVLRIECYGTAKFF